MTEAELSFECEAVGFYDSSHCGAWDKGPTLKGKQSSPIIALNYRTLIPIVYLQNVSDGKTQRSKILQLQSVSNSRTGQYLVEPVNF